MAGPILDQRRISLLFVYDGADWIPWDGAGGAPGTGGLTDTELRATPVPVSFLAQQTLGVPPSTKAVVMAAMQQDSLSFNFGGDGNLELLKVDSQGALYVNDPSTVAITAQLPTTLGQKAMAASLSVTIASDQSAVPVSGPLTDVQLRATAIQVEETGVALAATLSIDAKTPALGQAVAASSVPVVLTAVQLTTLTPPAAITGFATETTQLLQATAANQLLMFQQLHVLDQILAVLRAIQLQNAATGEFFVDAETLLTPTQ